MKKLSSLMRSIDAIPLVEGDVFIEDITMDSRAVQPGTLFVARRGWYVDGHDYLEQAVANGASAVLVSRRDAVPSNAAVPIYFVADEDPALGLLAAEFFDHPTRALNVYGVTGTNGKTSTVWMLDHLLRSIGQQVAVLSTVAYRVADQWLPAPNTTPDALVVQRLARQAVDTGCQALVMEVSSHGAAIGRIAGTEFRVGGFTNFSRDHLDFHETEESYLRAKALFFSLYLRAGAGVKDAVFMRSPILPELLPLCGEEPVFDEKLEHLRPLMNGLPQRVPRTTIVGRTREEGVDILVESSGSGSVQGTRIHVQELSVRFEGMVAAAGAFQVDNAALAMAMVRRVEACSWPVLLEAMERFSGVPGRLELVADPQGDEPAVFVDYAHTSDAVRVVLNTAAELTNGPLWAVVGAGGDRDRGKRPMMAAAAIAGSDVTVLTSDNPRTEDPVAILDDVCAGLEPAEHLHRIVDRREAIAHAVSHARGGVVVVAGKGHERYEEVQRRRYFWDDADEARMCLAQRRYGLALPRRLAGWSPRHVETLLQGQWLKAPARLLFRGLSTDTRTLQPGDLFVALQGEHHDAHTLVSDAFAKGASAAVVERAIPEADGPQLIVASTHAALATIATTLLSEARAARGGLEIIGITGSNGKTTTRSFATALATCIDGHAPLATQGNFNNQIGLPLSVAALSTSHRRAILEMGASQAGDIAELVQMAPPDVAVLTSIAASHLAGFGSLDGVRFAKAEMLRAARPKVVVMPLGEADGIWGEAAAEIGATVLTFGGPGASLECARSAMDAPITVRGHGVWQGFHAQVEVPVSGRHNAGNFAAALLAVSVRDGALGDPPSDDVLRKFADMLVAPPGRMERYRVCGRQIIFDAYNANPASTQAALDTLAEFERPRIAVLGELFELGDQEAVMHDHVLRTAADTCDLVVAIGPRWPKNQASHVHVLIDRDAAAALIADRAGADATILWKGSRGARLEQLRDLVEAQWRKEMK